MHRYSQKTISMQLTDTHCHIHDSEFAKKFEKTADQMINDAVEVDVTEFVCVGTDQKSSEEAVDFCSNHKNCHASVALHPHEAADKTLGTLKKEFEVVENLARNNEIVAIGECGLDYFYHSSEDTREKQREVFRWHLELAMSLSLPVIFHIRDAFDDFFSIIDEYPEITGVVHSFSAGEEEAKGVVARGLYAGLNGIITFTKNQKQLDGAKQIPLEKLVLETDAPFLTPSPFRGTINEPKHVILITQFLSELRGESQALLAEQTTKNAKKLFKLN